MIFDTISVKARWEWWCRWNCDLRVINARNKGIFCCTESVAMTPKSHWPYAYYITLGSRCKMANSSSEHETDTLPERPSKDTAVSVWACQAGFWKSTGTSYHAVFHGVCEIALTEVLATQMGVMRRSKKVMKESIKLIHFRLTAARLRGSSCIVIPGVVCELLQIAATQ